MQRRLQRAEASSRNADQHDCLAAILISSFCTPTPTVRRGGLVFSTPHGDVQLPAFMPVATQATVKGLEIEQLRATGAEMVLGNTYHLTLRPGEEVVAALGGLHRFMGWDGPILTDSGGFQLFSLAHRIEVTEEQAVFRSHIDGRLVAISPERAVAIQEALGSDVAMVLDHVVGLPNDRGGRARRRRADRPLGPAMPRRRHAHRSGAVRHRPRRARPELRIACAGNCASWISPATPWAG